MKKYLMSFAALAFIASAFVSCTHDDIQNINELSQAEKYKLAFEAAFGTVIKTDANRTWGFENQTPLVFGQDGKIVTRGNDENANMWGGYVEVPDPLTTDQINLVTAYFSAVKQPQSTSVNWSDYFAQQVSSTAYGKNMDHLVCGPNDEHIGNFNGGDNGTMGNVLYADGHVGSDKINYMVDSSTSRFGFHNSLEDGESSTGHYYYNYVNVPGEQIMKWAQQTGYNTNGADVTGMFFVGFDYECHGTTAEKQINADKYYNDWIIKITPGLPLIGQRVFVEDIIAGMDDLSKLSISDWDFNDAVFDVRFEELYYPVRKSQAVITLRAAGGTLPLTVGGKEVHELFGVGTGTMVNTRDPQNPERPVVIFRIDTNVNNANDIPVYVNGDILLQALEKNPDTQKVAAPVGTVWVSEKVFINDVYNNFKPWLNGQAQYWYK